MGHVGELFGAESRETGLDRPVASDEFGMCGCDAERRGAADVLARQVDGAEVQPRDEFAQVLRRGCAVVLRLGSGGVTETAKVDGEHAMLPAQQGDQLVEHPPGLRETVHQQYGRSGRSRGDVVQLGAVHADAVVVDAGDGGSARTDVHDSSPLIRQPGCRIYN